MRSFKLAACAAAVYAVFGAAGEAFAQANTVNADPLCGASAGVPAGQTCVALAGSGASATRTSLINEVVVNFCVGDTSGTYANIRLYRDNGGGTAGTSAQILLPSGVSAGNTGTNITRIVCELKPAAQTALGAQWADISYDNAPGSYQGVGPVSRYFPVATRTPFPNGGYNLVHTNTTSCTGSGTTAIAATLRGTTTTITKTVTENTGCTVLNNSVKPFFGNADLEASLFIPPNLPAGQTAPDLSALLTNTQWGVVFGVAVSRPLFEALQDNQGITGCGAAGSRTLNTEACAPSLTKSYVASVLTVNTGLATREWTPAFSGTPPFTPPGPVVNVARRGPGSGTQATSNAFFANSPCSDFALAIRSAGSYNGGRLVVTESGSSGGVTGALNSTSNWVIGVVSRETSIGANWGFVKLDGVYPDRANAANGTYRFWSEQVLTLAQDPQGLEAVTAEQQQFYDDLLAATQIPPSNAGNVDLRAVASGGSAFSSGANTCAGPLRR